MIFTDHFFLLYFLPIFLIIYWLSHKHIQLANGVIIMASILFYASFGPENLPILLIPIFLDYVAAIFLIESSSKLINKLVLFSVIIINVGILTYFKYYDFFLANSKMLFSANIFETLSTLRPLSIPLGISFITFQRISYIVDIYHKKIQAEKNFISFITYSTLFPHLISGPIVRYSQIQHSLKNRIINKTTIFEGFKLLSFGLFAKAILADNLFTLESHIKSLTGELSSLEAFLLILSFSLRIYFDFAGYSLMAIGIAKLLGFSFPENFKDSYQTTSFQNFWKRWNITLSLWLRDYLYIPLGGSKKGPLRRNINILFTMLIGGLWHGANWNFIIWGGTIGIIQIIEKQLNIKKFTTILPEKFKQYLFFVLVSISWITFQFQKPEEIIRVLKSFFSNTLPDQYTYSVIYWSIPVLMLSIYLALHWSQTRIKAYYPSIQNSLLIVAIFFISLVGIFVKEPVPFIYFQF